MTNRHGERGQVLPLWAFGAITTFALMFLAINYANAVRYQIRAQNAADSAATALISIQSQRFNLMNVALYNANVEEYRLRRTLDGLMLATSLSGGCQPGITGLPATAIITPGTVTDANCEAVYQNLKFFYEKSENRYTADVQALQAVTSEIGFTKHFMPDANSLINDLGAGSPQCTSTTPLPPSSTKTYGDCALIYKIVGMDERMKLQAVQENADQLLIPGLGYTSTLPVDSENADLWAPAEVDVTTCVKVQPIIPNFGPIHLPVSYAIGRAAATDVMVEEDWLDPGAIGDPVRAGLPMGSATKTEPFQGIETYSDSTATASGNAAAAYNWYGVDFGGNPQDDFQAAGFFGGTAIVDDEMSARVGWWNAIPIQPFEKNPPAITAATQCAS